MKEEDLPQKLRLFESVIAHANVSWNEFHCVCVEERFGEFLLPKGSYNLLELVGKSQFELLENFRDGLSQEVSDITITIDFKNKKQNVLCSAIKADSNIECLWVSVPEKDNSIMYLQNAAHDFRSPLGSVIGVVNLLQHMMKEGGELDKDELVAYLDMIKLNTDKALNLASEIMELAEIESSEYELRKELVVMKDFVQRYIDTHRLLTLKKRIQVAFESHTDASVRLNESKMTRALDNVITNAVKFSKEGTRISFSLKENGEELTLSIVDQGIGMNKDILKKLFVKFGDAKRNGLNGEPTHGLGMSIVRQIMKLHQGDVMVSSEEQKGTQVDLILNKAK